MHTKQILKYFSFASVFTYFSTVIEILLIYKMDTKFKISPLITSLPPNRDIIASMFIFYNGFYHCLIPSLNLIIIYWGNIKFLMRMHHALDSSVLFSDIGGS